MKRNLIFTAGIILAIGIWLPITPSFATPEISQEAALKLGTNAYIYGYPLVTMEMTRRVLTNIETPEIRRAPMGQFINGRTFPGPDFKDVTAPNADTLYSSAWLNLATEPYVLHVPDVNNRYYLMEMLSGWTNVFASIGTRTTGTKAHDFAIIGPNWHATLPKGLIVLKSPTDMIWIIGRTYCTGTPEDYKIVHQIQDQYRLTPLSAYGKPYIPPKGSVDPNIDMKTPVRKQVNSMDAGIYFKLLATLLTDNPPSRQDTLMVAELHTIGIVAGKDFDINQLDPNIANGLQNAVNTGQLKIMQHYKESGIRRNGWLFLAKTGHYGTDYLQRAFVTMTTLGANLPQDSLYSEIRKDENEHKLSGNHTYVIHFDKGQLPPVKAFWSLTLYNQQYFFVDNPLHRYNLGSHDTFIKNSDGSIDLYIQHNSPGKDKAANWLPAPQDDFVLMMRYYWPTPAIINGTWKPPLVKQT